ncbi:hypothetical protein PR048_017687 [Dryococelus australis]|uniref:Uncharacterized protein n=1 Tax=Dryococelus australis TaxID=614101 RepID=A0ABQ9HAT3_9NEOP|nr:hypothetical protein PR048_017687 [Dryococelus australis]
METRHHLDIHSFEPRVNTLRYRKQIFTGESDQSVISLLAGNKHSTLDMLVNKLQASYQLNDDNCIDRPGVVFKGRDWRNQIPRRCGPGLNLPARQLKLVCTDVKSGRKRLTAGQEGDIPICSALVIGAAETRQSAAVNPTRVIASEIGMDCCQVKGEFSEGPPSFQWNHLPPTHLVSHWKMFHIPRSLPQVCYFVAGCIWDTVIEVPVTVTSRMLDTRSQQIRLGYLLRLLQFISAACDMSRNHSQPSLLLKRDSSHRGELGSIPGGICRSLHVRNETDAAAGQRVFSGGRQGAAPTLCQSHRRRAPKAAGARRRCRGAEQQRPLKTARHPPSRTRTRKQQVMAGCLAGGPWPPLRVQNELHRLIEVLLGQLLDDLLAEGKRHDVGRRGAHGSPAAGEVAVVEALAAAESSAVRRERHPGVGGGEGQSPRRYRGVGKPVVPHLRVEEGWRGYPSDWYGTPPGSGMGGASYSELFNEYVSQKPRSDNGDTGECNECPVAATRLESRCRRSEVGIEQRRSTRMGETRISRKIRLPVTSSGIIPGATPAGIDDGQHHTEKQSDYCPYIKSGMDPRGNHVSKFKKRGNDTGDTITHALCLIAPTRRACSVSAVTPQAPELWIGRAWWCSAAPVLSASSRSSDSGGWRMPQRVTGSRSMSSSLRASTMSMRPLPSEWYLRTAQSAGETGDPRENPPTNGIVRHDSHLPGIEPGSPWWEASELIAQPP